MCSWVKKLLPHIAPLKLECKWLGQLVIFEAIVLKQIWSLILFGQFFQDVLVIDYPTQLFSKLSSARGPHLTRHCCSWIQTTYHFTKYWSIFIFLLASWHRKIISSKGCGNWSKQLHIYICVIIWLGVQMAWRKWKVQFELLLLIYTQVLSLSQVCTTLLHCPYIVQ